MEYTSIFEFLSEDNKFDQIYQECLALENTISNNLIATSLRNGRVICELLIKKLAKSNSRLRKKFFEEDDEGNKPRTELFKIIKGCYKEKIIDKQTKEKYFTVKGYGDPNAHGEDYYEYDILHCQKVHKLLFELSLDCFKYFHDDDLKFDYLDDLKYSYTLNKLKPSKFTTEERMDFIDKIYEDEINKSNFINYINLKKIFINKNSFKEIIRKFSNDLIDEEGYINFLQSKEYLKENDMSELLSFFEPSKKSDILNEVREINEDKLLYIYPYLDDFPQDFTIEYLSDCLDSANEIEKDNFKFILNLAYNFLEDDLEILAKELENDSVIDVDEFGREIEKFNKFKIVKKDLGLKIEQVEKNKFLDKNQTAAVQYKGDKPLVINAGPGSGKTRVIIERVRFLVKNGVDPSTILVITFTNEATNELRNRLKYETDLGMDVINQMKISTIHGFCRYLIANFENLPYNYLDRHGERSLFINKYREELGFTDYSKAHDSDVAIITRLYNDYFNFGLESEDFATRLKRQNDYKIHQNYKNYVRGFEEKYGHFPSFKQIEEQGRDYRRAHYFAKWIAIVESYPKYNELLEKHKACDDNTILVKAYEILCRVKIPFTNILIDEFQDTDFHFMEIFNKLMENAKSFTIVGDPDQSIYGWRGALPHYFEKIISKDNRENIEYVELHMNYRATADLVDFSDELIKDYRADDDDKILIAKKQYKSPVYLLNNGFSNEFSNITSIIKSLRDDKKIKRLSDIAVLFRTNEEAMEFSNYLNANKIPFYLKGNKDLLERDEIKSILLLFWYLMPYEDKTNFVYRSDEFLNLKGFSMGFLDTFIKLSEETKNILANIQDNFERNVVIVANNINHKHHNFKKIFNQDIEFIEEVISKVDTFDLADLDDLDLFEIGIKNERDRNFFLKLRELKMKMFGSSENKLSSLEVFDELINLNEFLENISIDNSLESIKIRKNLAKVSKVIKDYDNIMDKYDYEGLFEYLNSVLGSYSSYIDESETYENEVHLMTVHKSKGLEYPVVIIASLADGDFPREYITGLWHTDIEFYKYKPDLVSDDKKQHYREEMRMIYVAATRAKELLILSSRYIKPQFLIDLKNNSAIEMKNLNSNNLYSLPKIESSNSISNSFNISELNFESIMKNYIFCPYRYYVLNDIQFAVEISDDDHVEMVLHRLLSSIHNQKDLTDEDIKLKIETILKYHEISFDERDHKIISNVMSYWNNFGKDYNVAKNSFVVSKALNNCDLIGTIDLLIEDDDDSYSIVQFIGSDKNIFDKNEYIMFLHFYVSALKETDEFKDKKLNNIILHSFYSDSNEIFEINELYEKYGLKELEKCTDDILNDRFIKKDHCEVCDLNNKLCKNNK